MSRIRRLAVALAVALGAALCGAPSAFAQTNFAGGLHFDVGFPQGEMNERIDSNAYGLSGQFFYAPSGFPLAIGIDASYMNYGTETRREPFSTTIPDVTVEVETSNNIVQALFVLRLRMPRGPIQVYGDGVVGFNYLYTETKIRDTDGLGEDIASSTNQDDTALAFGFGGGISVPVYTRAGHGAENDRPLQVLIDVGARYVLGGNARYLKKGSIRREEGQVRFDTIESETDLLRLQVGSVVRF